MRQKRVGIYAGSFNPVHEGHVAFAKEALESHSLDKVFFLIEPRPRRKQGVKSLQHRQAMVSLALSSERGLGAIFLHQDRFYPATTLPLLQSRFHGAEMFMLMGDDVVANLAQWPDADDMLKSVGFIVGARNDEVEDISRSLEALQRARAIKVKYHIFKPSKNEYSSDAIRTELKRAVKPSGLTAPVYEYIVENNLYGAQNP